MRTSTLSALFVIVIVTCVTDTGRAINVGGRIANGAKFVRDAYRGSKDMWRGYSDMRKANWVGADKYFHARANYDASRHGAGGRWAAETISDAREFWQGSVSGRGHADSAADQEANRWGRSGGDPNRYRPNGLPDEY